MSKLYKYKKTPHVPFSPGTQSDDRLLKSLKHFEGKRIVISKKMDGENTNIYPDHFHVRSLDSIDHQSRHWVKGLWGSIKHEIPEGWRICGENLFAKHSIFYTDLPSYFMVFSIWNEENICLSYSDTEIICKSLGLEIVPVIDIFDFDEKKLRDIANSIDTSTTEGWVMRNYDSFSYSEFGLNMAKWVRKKHVRTGTHWMQEKVVPNLLKNPL